MSARHFRNIYLVYLTVMIYIFVIVLSTDQELLFRAGYKQLPLVHISVPIVAFFTWIPWALLVLHFYLLIQVTFLSDKVRLYRQAIKDHLESEEDIRDAKMLLASVPLVHILVEEKGRSIYSTLLYLIVFVSLAVFPLMLLIMAQITFLPYQSELITWLHRIVILIDALMLWVFGRNILRSNKGKTIWINSVAGLLVILVPVFVVIVIFINFPGNKIYSSATASLYELEWANEIMPANRFVLPNRRLVKKEPAPELLATHIKGQMGDETSIEPGSPIWCQYADPLDLKGRNFREVQLQNAILCKATLQSADLTDADILASNLRRADLGGADLSGADLSGANLIASGLKEADLAKADLTKAALSGADLKWANLAEVDLKWTDLSGADITEANLSKADLTVANLSRANFSNAILDDKTILDFTWVWESYDSEEANLPIGIPRGWSDTLKPEYLCPYGFDVSYYIDVFEYIDKDNKVKREQLKARLKEVIGENCKRYYP